jgi:hypothetical protein
MPAPIDYGVNIADPTQAFLSAFQSGASVQESQFKQQQQQQQLANQQNIQEGFNKVRQPGATAADYANLSMLLPETQAKAVRESFGMLSGERQQMALQQSGQVFSAFKSGQPEIAISLMDQQIDAKRNSGDEPGAKFLETWRDVAKANPKATEDYFGFTISQMPGGDKVITSAISLGQEGRAAGKGPAELRESVAKADSAVADATIKLAQADNAADTAKADAELKKAQAAKAVIDAEFARRNAELEVQQKGATLRKTEADILINKENARIAALTAAAAKETNALRREELQQKINESKEKRDSTDREQKATFESQTADIDNFLNTAARIKQTPKDIIKQATGPIASRLPTSNQDVADFESLVDTLGSQAFISQIPKIKGTGALSENEGNKLQASLQNLSLKQSPERLIENVNEATRLLEKVRANISVRSGLPALPLDVPARVEVFVMLPNGNRAKFPNQAAADAYKKQAGIQ